MIYRYDPFFFGKNKLYKPGIYRHTRKFERIYTSIVVIEAGVTSSYYILSAYILKFLIFIILKGENGLKVFKWEGCLKEERRHFLCCLALLAL